MSVLKPAELLSVPSGKINRSASHESFATDVSLPSLSSFTSEIPSRRRVQPPIEKEDSDPKESKDNEEMMQFREGIFESMLESQLISLPRLSFSSSGKNSGGKMSVSSKVKATCSNKGNQEKEINTIETPRNRVSFLYKSFSTSELPYLHCKDGDKEVCENLGQTFRRRASSQTFAVSDFAKIVQYRRKHLKNLCDIDDFRYFKDFLTPTETDLSMKNVSEASPRDGTTAEGQLTHRSSIPLSTSSSSDRCNYSPSVTSKRKSSVGMFFRKLKFSKEIGRRIRADLWRKLQSKENTMKEPKISLTEVDLNFETGRPLNKMERNFMIFHWLQSLHDDSFGEP